MRKMKGWGALLLAGTLAVALSGCAKPPAEEKQAAESSMNSAITAQAEVYATAAMTEAKKLWDDAEAKMQHRAYKDAKIAYTAAKAGFDVAIGQVEAGKKAMAEENQTMGKSVEASWNELSKMAGSKVKKLEATVKPAWETDSKAIQDALAKAKDVANPAEAKKALADAKTLMDKWMQTFKK